MTTDKSRSIVTYVHRPKRPPRKKAQPAALTGPAIVRAKGPTEGKHNSRLSRDKAGADPANDDRQSSIVTVGRPRGRFGDAPDLTPEEIQRRHDAADALFKELVRRATGSERD
jgi:hypothetical protein